MRFLVGYESWRSGVDLYYEKVWQYLRQNGFDIHGFCLTIDPPQPRKTHNQISLAWESCDRKILKKLASLETALDEFDVFINLHGSPLPVDFINKLPVCTVFVCNDDPESTRDLSRPTAWAYDQCLVGNIAAIPLYEDWGIENTRFMPLGFAPWDVDPKITERTLNLHRRTVDLVFFGERESVWRKNRLNRISKAFPKGCYHGRGWPGGYLSKEKMLEIYSQSKIGFNIHNSTGPINQRLYQLPAHGVLQICDNKSTLSEVFEPGKEIIGYETIGECIELIDYYLENEEERIRIAFNGFLRAHRDYSITAIWKDLEKNLKTDMKRTIDRPSERDIVKKHAELLKIVIARSKNSVIALEKNIYHTGLRIVRKIRGGSVEKHLRSDDEEYPDITSKYPNQDINLYKKYPVKIGILTDFLGDYRQIITACEDVDVPFSVIDFFGDNWLKEVKRSSCDGYFVRPTHAPSVWKDLFDERVRVMVEDLGLIVWPRPEDIWIYEGKRRSTYWLKTHRIPHPDTHIFYDFDETRDFLLRAKYPLVYKTHLGSAASGVIFLKKFRDAKKITRQAFSEGVTRKPGDKRDKSWGYIILQEFIPDAREFRVIKIGNSWFGHEKLMDEKTFFHSGSDLVKWGAPPLELMNFCREAAEIGGFPIMCFDVFLTSDGRWLMNELQTVFGSYNPSQMYVETEGVLDDFSQRLLTWNQVPLNMKPGRYLNIDGKWVFEEGLFNRNGSNNLKILSFAEYLSKKK